MPACKEEYRIAEALELGVQTALAIVASVQTCMCQHYSMTLDIAEPYLAVACKASEEGGLATAVGPHQPHPLPRHQPP